MSHKPGVVGESGVGESGVRSQESGVRSYGDEKASRVSTIFTNYKLQIGFGFQLSTEIETQIIDSLLPTPYSLLPTPDCTTCQYFLLSMNRRLLFTPGHSLSIILYTTVSRIVPSEAIR